MAVIVDLCFPLKQSGFLIVSDPATNSCTVEFWACLPTVQCIERSKVCDMQPDCKNGADEHEKVCRNWTCEQNHFKCVHQCLPNRLLCDKKTDCIDVPEICAIQCNELACQCVVNTHKFIPRYQVCDGINDCNEGRFTDFSDETDCLNKECAKHMTKCSDDKEMCINMTQICDGEPNCKSGSDELCSSNCYKLANVPEKVAKTHMLTICSVDRNTCVPEAWYCEGRSDCPQGSDEVDCSCKDLNLTVCRASADICVPIQWGSHKQPCTGLGWSLLQPEITTTGMIFIRGGRL